MSKRHKSEEFLILWPQKPWLESSLLKFVSHQIFLRWRCAEYPGCYRPWPPLWKILTTPLMATRDRMITHNRRYLPTNQQSTNPFILTVSCFVNKSCASAQKWKYCYWKPLCLMNRISKLGTSWRPKLHNFNCVTEVACVTNQSLTVTSIQRTVWLFPLKFIISRFSKITNLRFNEQIWPFPSGFIKSRFHCTLFNSFLTKFFWKVVERME